jgi:CRP/FNR family cyclic AMP-dependent transcriptional regulator
LIVRRNSVEGAAVVRRGEGKMSTINMQMFAKNAGVNLNFPAGSVIFHEGDAGDCLYVLQSGVVEMLIHDRIVDVCGANEAIGFLSVIDGSPRTATARVKEAAEVSVIDQRKFRFMIDEVPNFAYYIMDAMAHRIRGMRQAI